MSEPVEKQGVSRGDEILKTLGLVLDLAQENRKKSELISNAITGGDGASKKDAAKPDVPTNFLMAIQEFAENALYSLRETDANLDYLGHQIGKSFFKQD